MFLALDSHEAEIARAAALFLQREFPLERLHRRPQDPRNLRPFAELGWLGLSAPEAVGGSGLTVVEEMLFFLELGRVAGPLAVLNQVLAIAAVADNTRLLAPLLAGEAGVALLVDHQRDEVRLLGATDADYAVQVTPRGAILYLLDVSALTARPCLDRSVAMHFGSPDCLTIVGRRRSYEVWQQLVILVSAMQIGIAERALEMIVDYARQRETFGRAIGAYQAVRHPCADMAVRIEGARSQLFYAATAIKEQHPDRTMHVDAAQLLAERAARLNTDANIQLHGGIGVTDEHHAHLLMKRANLLGRLVQRGKAGIASLLDLQHEETGV